MLIFYYIITRSYYFVIIYQLV